jgi:hypothetical protein
MSSKIKKNEKYQDRIKELEVENTRLRKELEDMRNWWQESLKEREEFDRMYKGGRDG